MGYHQNAVSPANPSGLNTTNGYIMTPNIDALAAQGIKLENYYVQPLCSPTRGTVMTGRYPSHTGVGPNVIRPTHPYGLPGDEVTIAQVMKSAGYATAAVGKWHLGFCDERYTPTFRGFDSFLGYLLGAEDYYAHTRSDEGFSGLDFRNSTLPISAGVMPPATDAYKGNYSTFVFADRVEAAVQAHAAGPDAAKPLFVYMPFQAVHGPLEAPQSYIDKYAHIADKKRRTYAAMVTALDDAVGQIVDAYKAAGLWDDTVLVFSTDNGPSRFR